MPAKHITSAEFETFLTSKKLVMVDCFATWCGPCQMLSPLIDQLADELADKVAIAKLDIDESPELADKLAIEVVPTLLFYKNGKLTKTHKGLITKEELLKLL